MKHFMLRSLMLFSLLFSTLGVNSVWAQLASLEVGKVYHFTNANYTEKAMGATNPRSVAGVAADANNKAQLWYVESNNEHGYALRNLGFGTYLQANGQSSRWTLASTTESNNSWITLETVGSNNAFKGYTYGNNGYAHIDGSSNVVGWTSSATSTQWTITPKEMTQAEIQNALNIFTSVPTIQVHLDNLFKDKSCTTLRGEFDTSNESYQALPTTLQAMVRKVAGNISWEEANSDKSKAKWDAEYAKKYRIQMYEPYCDPEKASAALALNQHSNMNNPTGLFANSGDVIYVMVEGEIKEGATLYLSYYTQHGKLGSATDGYELKQGLNVLPIYQDECNLYINYVVETFVKSDNTRGHLAKSHKLSEFPALKIHIEGGHINGYYNKMGDNLYPADKNANWDYLEARAPQKDLVILGQYMTLNFPLNDADTEGHKGMGRYLNDSVNVEDVINAWDNVMLWERMLLGVVGKTAVDAHSPKSPYSTSNHVIAYTGEDASFPTGYDDYYNIHGLAQGVGGNTYMYGSGDHSGYHYKTMDGIIQNMPINAGSHWGPAHEIGHQHQNLINMRGEMEVSNNLFSNVVLWMFGETTSRVNGTEGSLENVLKNFNKETGHYLNNSIWGMTQMYYKLFLYYHVLGHNPKFYPRLFEMLRQDPQKNNRAGQVDGANAQLHLYKKVCAAAEEDLTEFFRAHGFFKPLTNWSINDYGVSNYNMTQAQIDEAIADVKSNEWKENIVVLFINDATGETIQSHKGDSLELYGETKVCADLGGYGNFNTNEVANYTYNISGTTITMDGTGGVGFAILNEKGELIGFSNKKTFEVSAAAAEALASGRASVVTLNADNTSVEATNIMESGDNETKHNLLGRLLDEVKATLALSDGTGTKVGFYRENALTALNTIYTNAKAVHDEKTVSAYTPVYDELYREYANLLNDEYARINITEGYAYRLTNKAYATLSMGVETAEGENKDEMFGLTTAENDAQIWYFEAGTTAGTYYLKNKGTSLYPASASSGAVLKADKAESTKGEKGGAAPYTLQNMGNGVFALSNGSGLHCSSSQSYNIVGWGIDSEATQWYITAVELDNALEARLKLEEAIENTTSLINEMAAVIPSQNFKLQTEDSKAAYYLSTNACYNTLSGKTDGQGLAGLLDDKTSTYFHSDYSGNAEGTHYLQVDLGEGNAVGHFHFSYTIRDNGNNYPKEIKVEGSTNGIDFNELLTLTEATHNLPTKIADEWESPLIENPEHYRYLRFSVTKTWGDKVYFVMSGFGIRNPEPIVNEVYSEFANDEASKEALKTQIIDALNEITEAQQLVDGASAAEATYNAQCAALNELYNALLTTYNSVKDAALNAKKIELQTLIDNTDALIDQCGSVVYNEESTPQLNITAAPYLLTDNNRASQGSLDKLYDGKQGEAYSYTSSWSNTPTEASYLQVDLGSGNELEELFFTFTNRNEGNAPTPTEIVVSASADGNNFTTLTTFTSEEANWPPAPNGQNIAATKWTSPVIEATSACRYWRFTVTKSQRSSGGETNKNGIYHFGISEFGIVIPAACKVTVNEGMGGVTKELLLATYDENQEAKSTLQYATTELQVVKAIAELQVHYNALEAATGIIDEAKANLREKITQLEELINKCRVKGTTIVTKDVPCKLQTSPDADFYISTNAYANEGGIGNLLDNDMTSFFQTKRGVGEEHYLLVDAGENNKLKKFKFSYRPCKSPFPYTIVVEGSNNKEATFTKLATFTDLPTTDDQNWESSEIGNGTAYRYLRFNITKSGVAIKVDDNKELDTSVGEQLSNKYKSTLSAEAPQVEYCFAMSDFKLTNFVEEEEDIEILAGTVTEEQWSEAKDANELAKQFADDTWNADDLNTKTGELQTLYDALYAAYGLQVSLALTDAKRDQLLTGIDLGSQTIGTFSARYATLIPDGVTAYYATQEYSGGIVWLTRVETTVLPANQGVILIGEERKTLVNFYPAADEDKPADLSLNIFSNTASGPVTAGSRDFILANGAQGIGIYKAKEGITIGKGKAFIRLDAAAATQKLVLRFGGTTTDVDNVPTVILPEDTIYDLSGRRLNEVTKGGVYIVNGKKVFIK